MSVTESSHGAGAPAFGGSAAAEFNEAASVGVHICAAGPPQGANWLPLLGKRSGRIGHSVG